MLLVKMHRVESHRNLPHLMKMLRLISGARALDSVILRANFDRMLSKLDTRECFALWESVSTEY